MDKDETIASSAPVFPLEIHPNSSTEGASAIEEYQNVICTNCGDKYNNSANKESLQSSRTIETPGRNTDNNNSDESKLDGNYIDEKYSRFSEWIHCMCVVTFDLELGQAMEQIYPKTATLSEQEKMNICYLAFPDSNSSCMGDTQYHVRLRLSTDNIDSFPLNSVQKKFFIQCFAVQKPDLAHYWGFVYFRQKRDKTIPRGYFQKSFIILTRLPFFNLFNEIVSLIAPRYFNDGMKILDIVYEQISQWPSLQAGESYELQLLGNVYQTIIPKSNSKSHSSNNNSKRNQNKLLTKSNSENLDNNKPYRKFSKSLEDENLCRNCEKNNQIIKTIGPILPPQVLTSVHEIDIFRSLSTFITNIFTLWELILTAEPIVIMGTSPTDCSYMVQSIISLISPLAYFAEYRPYFTIHDSEFKEFTTSKGINTNYMAGNGNLDNDAKSTSPQSIPSIILGVTNPFFGKLLQNWPHMIKLPDNAQQIYSIIPKVSQTNTTSNTTTNNSDYFNMLSTLSIKMNNHETNNTNTTIQNNSNINSSNNSSSSSNSTATNIINMVAGSGNDSNSTPGLYTKYKPFLKKDKTLIKKIQLGIKTKRPEQVQSVLLRRHFLELTQSFMIPLERYMASLMPLQKDISPFKAAPNPNQFKQDDFLATLEQSGPHLTSPLKGNWKGLYKRFFKSVNFRGWYENRHHELKQTLQALQLQALSDADLNQWAQGKQEVEIVDMILKLKQKLTICSESQLIIADVLKSSTRMQLLKQLDSIMKSLPDDLKTIIEKTT